MGRLPSTTATLTVCMLIACAPKAGASGELRVVTYNTTTTIRPDVSTVLEAIGAEEVNGLARPIDVLALQEQSDSASDTQQIVDMLNSLYGAGSYDRATLDGDTNGGGRPGLVYNTQTIELLDQATVGIVSDTGQSRHTLRYQLRPIGFDDGLADFYLYNSHYKSGTGSTNQGRRLVEAEAIRADLDRLGDGVAAILAGDYNTRSSSEPSYQELLSVGPGQAFDPIDTPGSWHDDQELKHTHTQAPTADGGSGLIGGGIDDRFDFQLVTGELLDGEGLDYISGSYQVLGNNGSHICCNSDLSTGNGASAEILAALESASDHLPVFADYQLPELMELLAGDFNADKSVDVADYQVWRDGLGTQYTLTDYDDWKLNFGQPAAASQMSDSVASSNVPEPSSLLLILSLAGCLAASRRR